jgi:hypothetical protein
MNNSAQILRRTPATFGGTAFYPTKLGPVAPGPGNQLFPRLYKLACDRGIPTWSYFCVGADLVMSECDVESWREWYKKGCDFFGYAWGTPPDFRPHPQYEADLKVVRRAFKEIAADK